LKWITRSSLIRGRDLPSALPARPAAWPLLRATLPRRGHIGPPNGAETISLTIAALTGQARGNTLRGSNARAGAAGRASQAVPSAAGSTAVARRLEHVIPRAELDPWTTVRFSERSLRLVDRLPARVRTGSAPRSASSSTRSVRMSRKRGRLGERHAGSAPCVPHSSRWFSASATPHPAHIPREAAGSSRRRPRIPARPSSKDPARGGNPRPLPLSPEPPRPACHAGRRGFESRRSRFLLQRFRVAVVEELRAAADPTPVDVLGVRGRSANASCSRSHPFSSFRD
jgi:hypothetical protein